MDSSKTVGKTTQLNRKELGEIMTALTLQTRNWLLCMSDAESQYVKDKYRKWIDENHELWAKVKYMREAKK